MIKSNKLRKFGFIGFVILITLVGLTVGNLQLAKNYPEGFDFIAHWEGTKIFVSDGISPYSNEAANRIMTIINSFSPENHFEKFRFLNPLYSLIAYVPLTIIQGVNLSRAVWMTVLEIWLVFISLFSLRLTQWKRSFFTFFILIFAVLSYSSFEAILSGNLIILTLGFVLVSILAIVRNNDETAGLFLALALIKPDSVYFMVLLTLIWAIIRNRPKIIYWFLGSFSLLIGFSMLLIPDWPIQYLRTIIQFGVNNPIEENQALSTFDTGSIRNRFLIAKNLFLILLLIIEWFIVKRSGNRRYVWLATLTLVIAPWIGFNVFPENVILSLPGLFFASGLIYERWKEKAFPIIIPVLGGIFLLNWIFSSFFVPTLQEGVTRFVHIFTIPFLSILLLYWSRWWVIHTGEINTIGVQIDTL